MQKSWAAPAYKRRLLHRTYSSINEKRWPGWQLVVGIEVHAQIKSRAKLFSHAWTSGYDEQANAHVAAFDAAFPGTLPKLNSTCVDLAARTALALQSQIQRRSAFDRKHYFYSDLPSGYQITQRYAPLARGGELRLRKSGRMVNIKQLQLEQDTAKSAFVPEQQRSVIDLNRAGSALMEIVSEPDMRSPEEAGEYVRTLQSLLRSVGSSDGNMDEGSLRCDVNVSVNRPGMPPGTRCEIKNLNSIKFLMIAITSEALRHVAMLDSGQFVAQETRGFDEHSAETFALRSKEDAPDYRYLPDPNLPPIILSGEYVERIRKAMPELPGDTYARLTKIGLNTRDVEFIMSVDAGREVSFDGQLSPGIVSFFDAVAQTCNPKTAFNWISHDLYGILLSRGLTFKENPVSITRMRELISMVEKGTITNDSARILLTHMLDNHLEKSPADLAREHSLLAYSQEDSELDDLYGSAIAALPSEVDAIRRGNDKVLNKVVGYVMKKCNGRADALVIRERLKKLIGDS